MASTAQIYPLHILIASLASPMDWQRGEVLECLIEENRASGRLAQFEHGDLLQPDTIGVEPHLGPKAAGEAVALFV